MINAEDNASEIPDDSSRSTDDLEEKRIPRLKDDAIYWDFDDAAAKEAQLFGSGDSIKDIKKAAEKRESDRAERFRDNFETISIFGIWGLFIIFSILTGVWAAHLMLPERYQFLDKTQLDKLQIIITSGFVTGIATSHIKKRLS